MPESRRIAQSIHTREIIPTSLAGDDACYLIAVTGDQIEILSNLMNYAHRRINWCDEVIDAGRYFLPDEATWNDLQALVDDLEYRLMDTCSLDQIIALLECICAASRQNLSTLPGGWMREDDGSFPLIPPTPSTDPQVDEDACALAQLTWQMTWEILTEQLIPAEGFFYDTLVPGVVALCVVWGVAIWPLLAAAAVAAAVTALLEGAQNWAESNLINWMLANKHEAICLLYAGWQTGQEDAQHAWEANIEAAAPGEISILDGIGVKCCLAMALPAALKAWALQSDWAIGIVQEDVCDDCLEPGCYDFCDVGWTIDPNYGLLDPEACAITLYGELGSPTAAWRLLEGFVHVTVTIDFDPPAYYPPAFYAVTVYVKNALAEEETFTFETSDNSRQALYHSFALDNPTSLDVKSVAGTHTIVYSVCIEETP